MKKIFLEQEKIETSKGAVSIIPIPYEKTTSYQKGTFYAPEKILEASPYLEEFDIETGVEPCAVDVETLDILTFNQDDIEVVKNVIEDTVYSEIARFRFPIIIGGEHAISPFVVNAINKKCQKFGVVHFDAHADLRDTYEGTKYSHACALRRIREVCEATLSVGIRAYSYEEAIYIKDTKPIILHAWDLLDEEKAISNFKANLKNLPEQVFITFDVDCLDLSIMPGTGTPEPGGLKWYTVLKMLKAIFDSKTVIGADIVECLPQENSVISEFTAAYVIFKIIAYYKKYGQNKYLSFLSKI